jgi:hypothetical protein
VLGAAWYKPRTVKPARKSTDPAAPPFPTKYVRHLFRRALADLKALPLKSLDELVDCRWAVLQQVHREGIAEFDAPQLVPGFHRRTVTGRPDNSAVVAGYAGNFTYGFPER